jgi:hypothetical protein
MEHGEHEHVHDYAEASDQGEHYEAARHDPAHRLVEEQHQEFPGDCRIELAFSVLSAAKDVGHLRHSERPRRGDEDIEQNLVAGAGQSTNRTVECVAL